MSRIRVGFLVLAATILVIAPVHAKHEPGPAFTLAIYPSDEPVLSHPTIPRQLVDFLLTVDDTDPTAGPVHVTAAVTDRMADVAIQPRSLSAGTVGELIVTPTSLTKGYDQDRFLLEITATRGGWVSRDWRTLEVMNMTDEGQAEAYDMLGRFIPWLEAQHPELGITGDTQFTATVVAPALIVTKYLFFTADLEVGLLWHSGSWGSDAWAHMYVRHRWIDATPSVAAHIDSYPNGTPVYEMAPPAQVMRTTDFVW